MKLKIALTGNPNSGKTTIFNELTGSAQEVGNWPGVTVEWARGEFEFWGYKITLVDLPGIYSLFPHSPEQSAICGYLLGEGDERPDIIIDVVDVTNLERSLYLTSQLVGTGLPLIVALNMHDELLGKQMDIDEKQLSVELGAPCVKISASQNEGLEKLFAKVINIYKGGLIVDPDRFWSHFDPEIKNKVAEAQRHLTGIKLPDRINPRWATVQILEDHWQGEPHPLLSGNGNEWEALISIERYRVIEDIVARVIRPLDNEDYQKSSGASNTGGMIYRKNYTKEIDRIVCNRILALPIFLLVMLSVFYISFGSLGRFLVDRFTYYLLDILPDALSGFLTVITAPAWFNSMMIDGVVAGVGGIMVFLPQLFLLYFCLAILEDSGYMARTAFITDRFLSFFGLSGNAFIPMILGFGCSVPAITACRTFDNRREKLLSMLIIPFISCSGRLPVYALITSIFFAANGGLVMFSIYIIGILAGLISVLLLRPVILRGRKNFFIMEMPPYRLPVWSGVGKRAWLRTWDFISRAGSVILVASIIIWFLNYFDWHLQVANIAGTENILQSFAKFLTPLFVPLGFGYWQMSVALLTGLMSKEAVVSGLSILYANGSIDTLPQLLSGILTPLAAYSFVIFVLLYVPCIATLITIKRESKSWSYMFFVIVYQIIVAWLAAFLIYQGGIALGLG